MKDIAVAIIGAGKIGSVIATKLAESGDYNVMVGDNRPVTFSHKRIRVVPLDARESFNLRGKFAVINAGPHHLTRHIVNAVLLCATPVHYLDLTEDVSDARWIKDQDASAGRAFIPQCGLAPGFVSIVAADMAKDFEILDTIKLRVGALPQTHSNAPLGYNLTWSTDGLINEYCGDCDEIANGRRCVAAPLGGLEELSIDGTAYEAFNTSGGVGTLCDTFQDRVRYLNYRTLRYPGHAAIMRVLLQDLRLRDDRATLKHILERAIPSTDQDKVVIYVSVSGYKKGRYTQDTQTYTILAAHGQSAIQRTTASAACVVLDLLAQNRVIPQQGLIRQEDIPLGEFLGNRFSKGVYTPL